MTQILTAAFDVPATQTTTIVRTTPEYAHLRGHLVGIRFFFNAGDLALGEAPRERLYVSHVLMGANVVILPRNADHTLTADAIEKLPLRLACREGDVGEIHLHSRSRWRGFVAFVLHQEADVPHRFAVELVAR